MHHGTDKYQTIDDVTQMLESEEFSYLPVYLIDPDPNQLRVVFEPGELEELANSVRAQGVIQPILVMISPHDHNRYMIIDGERRWRASRLAEQQNIPAVIKRNISDNAREDMQLLSFFSRVDLNPVEMANALELLIQKRGGEAKVAAAELGVSEGWISQRRKILKLPQDVQTLAIEGIIKDRQTLNKLGDYSDDERSQIIEKIRSGEFNSSELVKRKEDNAKKKKKKQNIQKDPNIIRLENKLREKTGTEFTFRHNKNKGTGSVTFHYTNLDHLDGLLQYFQIERDE